MSDPIRPHSSQSCPEFSAALPDSASTLSFEEEASLHVAFSPSVVEDGAPLVAVRPPTPYLSGCCTAAGLGQNAAEQAPGSCVKARLQRPAQIMIPKPKSHESLSETPEAPTCLPDKSAFASSPFGMMNTVMLSSMLPSPLPHSCAASAEPVVSLQDKEAHHSACVAARALSGCANKERP